MKLVSVMFLFVVFALLASGFSSVASGAIRPIFDVPMGTKIFVDRANPNVLGCVAGAKGVVSGVRHEIWYLIEANGDGIGLYLNLRQGFTAWDWEATDFPNQPVGVLFGNIVARMDDGSEISVADACGITFEDPAFVQAFNDEVDAKQRVVVEKVLAAKKPQGSQSKGTHL